MAEGEQIPRCAVIVLSYNSKDYLEKCINSLRGLDYPKDRYEVVIVDNASPDGSAGFVRSNFPEVKLIANEENVGFAKGNNTALSSIDSDYYILLNPDTYVEKDWLSRLVEVAQSSEKIGLCSSKLLAMDEKTKINYAGGMLNYLGFSWPRGFNETDVGQFEKTEETAWASGAAMLIKKDVIEKIGLLDGDYFMYYEDIDYSWRARMAGYRIMYVPKSVAYHKHEASVKIAMGSKRKFYHLEMNRLESVLKNYSRRSLAVLMPFIVLVEIGLVIYFLLVKRSLLKLFGYGHLIRKFRRIMEKRDAVQGQRIVGDDLVLNGFTYLLPRGFVPDRILPAAVAVFRAYHRFFKKLM